MGYRVLALAALGLVAVLALPSQALAQVERGAKIFADSKCSLCHAVAGKGNAKGVLDEVGSKLTVAEIREWLVHPDVMREKAKADRKPLMKSFSTLSKDDLDALVGYLQTLKKK